ncbi:MAG: hypothetical protein SNF33_03290 [Candidatus Algichlamydia australiensis]|nr:hypothetical protein [Chlamydiales bacterium]
MRKRYSYLLFEVVIGIGLLGLCLTMLTMRPILCGRKTFKDLEAIELERIAEVTFAEIQEEILHNHPFASFALTEKEAKDFDLDDYLFTLVPGKPRKLKRSYKIWKRRKQFGADGHNVKLVRCDIFLGKNRYSNLLFLEETSQ